MRVTGKSGRSLPVPPTVIGITTKLPGSSGARTNRGHFTLREYLFPSRKP
jgi:hypothetical protein